VDKIYIPKGDKGYNINFTVRDSSGNAYTITTYTITLKVWKPGHPESLVFSGACVIDSGVLGTCHYVVASGNFDSIGKFMGELELTKTGVIESTQAFEFEVTESG
jgi:hypothetical protein